MEVLDDIALSLILCYLDDISSLFLINKSCNKQFKNEVVWEEACSLKWGPLHGDNSRQLNYEYFNSFAICFKCISKWKQVEGIYSVLDAFPFGIGIKLVLLSESLFAGYVIDNTKLSMLFQLTILPTGKTRMTPGVVISIDTNKNSNLVSNFTEFSPCILPKYKDMFHEKMQGSLLSNLRHFANSASKINNPSYGSSKIKGNKSWIKYPVEKQDKRISLISLCVQPLPVSFSFDPEQDNAACYCGGPFESIFTSLCGCSDSKWTMMQHLISRGTNSNELYSFTSSFGQQSEHSLTLVKCGSLPVASVDDRTQKPLLVVPSIFWLSSYFSENTLSMYLHPQLMNAQSIEQSNESGYFILDVPHAEKYQKQLMWISSHGFEVKLGELQQEMETMENQHNQTDPLIFSIVDEMSKDFNFVSSPKLVKELNNFVLDVLIDIEMLHLSKETSIILPLKIGIKVTGDWKVPMGDTCFVLLNKAGIGIVEPSPLSQQTKHQKSATCSGVLDPSSSSSSSFSSSSRENNASTFSAPLSKFTSLIGTPPQLLSHMFVDVYVKKSAEVWLRHSFVPLYNTASEIVGWQCKGSTTAEDNDR